MCISLSCLVASPRSSSRVALTSLLCRRCLPLSLSVLLCAFGNLSCCAFVFFFIPLLVDAASLPLFSYLPFVYLYSVTYLSYVSNRHSVVFACRLAAVHLLGYLCAAAFLPSHLEAAFACVARRLCLLLGNRLNLSPYCQARNDFCRFSRRFFLRSR